MLSYHLHAAMKGHSVICSLHIIPTNEKQNRLKSCRYSLRPLGSQAIGLFSEESSEGRGTVLCKKIDKDRQMRFSINETDICGIRGFFEN